MPITPELKRIYASAPFDARYVETLELSHPRFPRTYYLANDVIAWTFLLESGAPQAFERVPFHIIQPAQDGRGQQDMELQIDNIGREAMEAIELAAANPEIPITAIFRVYLDRPDTMPQNDPPLILSLQAIVVTADAISGTATRADVLNRPFPSQVYNIDLFPGLDR